MGGNRKHGFRSGSHAGRNGARMPKKWYCHGCQKEHGAGVVRNRMLDGYDYCDTQYLRIKEQEFKQVTKGGG